MDLANIVEANATQLTMSLNATQFNRISDILATSTTSLINDSTIIAAVITGLIGLIVTGINLYYNKVLETKRIESTTQQKQQQAYSQLVGRKSMMAEILDAYHLTIIASETLYLRSILSAISQIDFKYIRNLSPTESYEEFEKLFEKLRERSSFSKAFESQGERYQDLQLKLSESNERLWETIGLIQAIFPTDSELERLIKEVYDSENDFENLRVLIFKEYRPLRKSLHDEAFKLSNNEERNEFYKNKTKYIEEIPQTLRDDLKTNCSNFKLKLENLLNHIKTKR